MSFLNRLCKPNYGYRRKMAEERREERERKQRIKNCHHDMENLEVVKQILVPEVGYAPNESRLRIFLITRCKKACGYVVRNHF